MSYYAVLIGVTTTAMAESVMPRAVQTATAMQTFLQSASVPAENMRLLAEPTRDQVDTALAWLQSVVTATDTLLVMYVGHGIEGTSSIPYGWALTSSDKITADELARWLDSVPSAARRSVISDCCYRLGITVEPQRTTLFGLLCARLRYALALLRQRFLVDFDAMARGFAERVIGKTHTVDLQAPMICIAGAAVDREVDDGRERLLVLLTIGAAAAGSIYSELQGDFDRVKDGNSGFFIQATPPERAGEVVLATPGFEDLARQQAKFAVRS